MSIRSLEQLGYFRTSPTRYRKCSEFTSDYQYLAIKTSAVDTSNKIDFSKSISVAPKTKVTDFIRRGDVLIPLRSNISPVLIHEIPSAQIMAVGEWAIITPDPDILCLEYLEWYWQHPFVQERLNSTLLRLSNGMKYVRINDLKCFTIHCPSLQVHHGIIRRVSEHIAARKLREEQYTIEDRNFQLQLIQVATGS
jgi:hypothetical protein